MNGRWRCVWAALLLLPVASGAALAGLNQWTSNLTALGDFPRVAANPDDPQRLYTWDANTSPFFRSLDGGASWAVDTTISNVGGIVFEPGSVDTIYALARGVWKSVDAGEHWQHLGFDPVVGAGVSQLVIGKWRPRTIYIGYGGDAGGVSGAVARIHRSTDSGQTWTTIFDSGFVGSVLSLVVALSAPTIYAFLGGRAFRLRVFSRDGGETWSGIYPMCLGDPYFWAYFETLDEAVDPRDPNLLYYTGDGRLFRSNYEEIDAGLPVPSEPAAGAILISNLVIDPTNPARLYAATAQGVYRTIDGGFHWTKFSDGLPDGPRARLRSTRRDGPSTSPREAACTT